MGKGGNSGTKMKMRSRFQASQQHHLLFLAAAISFNLSLFVVSSSDLSDQLEGGGLRGLKSFKEKPSDGSNVTLECSPSGPCVPCLYSEKKEDIFRCSETGYRIPMKCGADENHTLNLQEHDSSSANVYRSCITAVNEEKLSVLGFEAFMLTLLLASSFVIFRRKGSLISPGAAVRVPSNPRF